MKKNIERINQLVADKRNKLKSQASRSFEAITFPTAPVVSRGNTVPSATKTPGLTYVLYSVAVIFVIIALCTDDANWLFFILASLCAIGGFMFSKRVATPRVVSASSPHVDINDIKTSTISKGIDSVKNITREWDDFMDRMQKEMYAVIDSSSLSESQKDSLSSRIFSYEVIDINLSDLMSMINSATSVSEIKQRLDNYKSKLMNAIDEAANKQMNKYNSLVEVA